MGFIKVRMKKTSELEGENPSAVHAYGAGNELPRMVYPGEVYAIPDDAVPHLDKDGKKIESVSVLINRDTGERAMLTEYENRQRLIKNRGLHAQFSFLTPAPVKRGAEPKVLKQEDKLKYEKAMIDGFLKHKHFNPVCMEIVSNDTPLDNDDDPASKGWDIPQTQSKSEPSIDISKMSDTAVVELIKKTTDSSTLEYYKTQEEGGMKRGTVLRTIELQIKNANGQ